MKEPGSSVLVSSGDNFRMKKSISWPRRLQAKFRQCFKAGFRSVLVSHQCGSVRSDLRLSSPSVSVGESNEKKSTFPTPAAAAAVPLHGRRELTSARSLAPFYGSPPSLKPKRDWKAAGRWETAGFIETCITFASCFARFLC